MGFTVDRIRTCAWRMLRFLSRFLQSDYLHNQEHLVYGSVHFSASFCLAYVFHQQQNVASKQQQPPFVKVEI